MLGKAGEIKTILVAEVGGTPFDQTLNRELELLQECTVIDIRFTSTPDKEGFAWFNALIIYKEDVNDETHKETA